MVLTLVGLGLGDVEDLTDHGILCINASFKLYILASKFHPYNKEELENHLSRELISIHWENFDSEIEKIVLESRNQAEDDSVCLLMPGNPFCDNLYPKIKKLCDKFEEELKVVHNTSYMNAMGNTGIQLYKFGETAFIEDCSDQELDRCLKIVQDNLTRKLNTLIVFNRNVQNMFSYIREKLSEIDPACGDGASTFKLVLLLRKNESARKVVYGTLEDVKNVIPDDVESLSVCFEFDCVEEEYLREMQTFQNSQEEKNCGSGNFCIVGLGLGEPNDISLRGKRQIEMSHKVFLEGYTSIMLGGKEEIEAYFKKEVVVSDREMVEQNSDQILDHLGTGDVSFLVVGDPFGATTHTDIILRAMQKANNVVFANNASIINAIGLSGLKPKKFGSIISIPFWQDSYKPDSFYDKISANKAMGWHTLCLLDIQVKEQSFENLARGRKIYEKPRFMDCSIGAKQLLESKEKRKQDGRVVDLDENSLVITLSRIGTPSEKVSTLLLGELPNLDFGLPLHSLIIIGDLDDDENAIIKLKH